jgi:hypothetical protein
LWDAIQYQPIMNGASTWQTHVGEGFDATAWYGPARWMPVRVEVHGSHADLYLGDDMTPTMAIELERGITSGGIALTGGFRDDAPEGEIAATFRRLTVEETPVEGDREWMRPEAPDDDFIRAWSLSEPVAIDALPVTSVPSASGSQEIWAEPRGLVDLNRHFTRLPGVFRSAVVAETVIESPRAMVVPVNFDYSDEVSVFLNGELLFSGTNNWNSRYPYYLGTVDPNALQNIVHLHLRPGENRLTMVVSEQYFGWGFAATMALPNGVELRTGAE